MDKLPDQDGKRKKLPKILIAAVVIIAVIVALLYFLSNKTITLQITAPVPKEGVEEITKPPADPTLLTGLWKGERVYPYPRILEIKDGQICNSWSGQTLEDFACYEYGPFTTEKNILLLDGNPVYHWEIADKKLILTPVGSTTKDVYERAATSTHAQKPAVVSKPPVPVVPEPSPKPEPLKSLPWKTYENAAFGYLLNHPADYLVKRGRGLDPDSAGAYVAKIEDLDFLKQSAEPRYDLYDSPFNDFMIITAAKGSKSAEWIDDLLQGIACPFDEHYLMKLDFVGEVKIGKGNYPAKKYRGNICTFGKTIKKNVDIIEAYVFEYDGYTYYIEVAWVRREFAWRKKIPLEPRFSSVVDSFELISRTPLPSKPLRFLYPQGGEVWRMKEGVYTIRWTADDFLWHNGYGTSGAKGGVAVLSQVPKGDGFETHIAETNFDAGEYTWTIPRNGRVFLDSDARILLRVFPRGMSTTTHNPYFIYSEPFIIKPLVSEYPPIAFFYPTGGEEIKLGTPTTFRWNVLPPEIEKMGLYIIRQYDLSDPTPQGVTSGSILPQKTIKNQYGNDEYVATGWTGGMTSYAWDGKTIRNGPYIETIEPGRFVLQLNFVMPDKFFTYIESQEFTITSP